MTEERKFNLCFFGSRSLDDDRVKSIMKEEIQKYKPTAILTAAEPHGVCLVAKEIAQELSIPLKMHFLNFKYLRGAFEHRSKDILNDADYCILIHDGESIGTANEFKLAKKMKIPYTYHHLEKRKEEKEEALKGLKSWDEIDIGELK